MTAASRTEVYFNWDELEGEGLDPGDDTRDRLGVEVMRMLLVERLEGGCGRVFGVGAARLEEELSALVASHV